METYFPLILLATVVMAKPLSFGTKENQLSYNYYEFSCPNLETVIKSESLSLFLTDATAPAAFLRLMFHDCQVQGCDASILLDSNYLTSSSEMISSRNFGIRKRDTISHIKSVLEEECPGQVSCADIIVLAAKESVSFSGGPHIQVPLGRKDSRKCSFEEADAELPSPTITVDEFLSIFMSKGMNIEESVSILGAHTLGVGHCLNIAGRLYDARPRDNMDFEFEASLRMACPTEIPLTNLTFVPNDMTPVIFDNHYYRDIIMGRGLFGIDASISRHPRTAPFVMRFAMDQNYFFEAFSSAFVKLSSTNVLTNGHGEVRRQCNRVN
ncbi:peroxidase 29 [Gastrolobium bilobum]|uniref:peroxidase 29 n=1 Tax=Gastrolobium bilobum TaxID=150636 RepID=UPI002AB2B2D0|nr:peroxidase 29 [Gastrolobium bilobum]